MKKRVVAALMTVVMGAFALTACGSGGSSSPVESTETEIAYQDEAFMQSLKQGLQAHWDITDDENNQLEDSDYYTEKQKELYGSFVDAELNEVQPYANSLFKDTKLQEKAIAYINALNDQKDALEYVTVDTEKFDKLWGEAYDNRSKLLVDFVNDYGLTVDEKYQNDLDELMTNAKEVTADENQKKLVDDFADSIKFEKVKDESGFKTYQATAENTTGLDFEYLNLNINLLDKDDVIIESTTAYVSNYAPNAKARFEFSTEKDFEKIAIESVDYTVKEE